MVIVTRNGDFRRAIALEPATVDGVTQVALARRLADHQVDANLAGVALQLAARAPSPASRKQYASIFERFTTALAVELGPAHPSSPT